MAFVLTLACSAGGTGVPQTRAEGDVVRPRISEIEPAPNYRHSSLAQARRRLADGVEERFPMWTRAGGVTWTRRTPAALALEWSPRAGSSGVLEVHTSRGDYASVGLLRRLDLYARRPDGRYQRVGSRDIDDDELPERGQGWIGIPFTGVAGGAALVLHGRSPVFSIDEIRVRTAGATAASAPSGEPLASLVAVRDDASARLREDLRARTGCAYPAAGDAALRSGWSVSLLSPYGPLHPCARPGGEELAELSGFGFESEPLVVRIENGLERAREIAVALEAPGSPRYTVEQLADVISADGTLVLDAIRPLARPSVRLRPGEIAHLWVEIELGSLPTGQSSATLWLRPGHEGPRSVQLVTRVAPMGVEDRHRMEGVAWSTLTPPIWSNFEAARGALAAGGSNVLMIPPWYVPVVTDYSDNPHGRRRFQDHLRALAPHGLVLVQLDAINRVGGCAGERRSAMIARMRRLVRLVQGAGVPFSGWAVYPADESHDEKLSELLACARAIKQADSRIQIYANPTLSKNPAQEMRLLRELQPYIDIWQPRAALVDGPLIQFFRSQRRFWIYDNPREPAKSDSPRFYRALAWRAWQLGASGTGFWGFDDTRKSSAWDDLDGTQPDWAAVYEGPTGPLASRRWRAFGDGLEDAAALARLHEAGPAPAVRAVLSNPSCHVTPRFPASVCRRALVDAVLRAERSGG